MAEIDATAELAPLNRGANNIDGNEEEDEWDALQPIFEQTKRQRKNCLRCGAMCVMCPCTLYRVANLAVRSVTKPLGRLLCSGPDFSIPPDPNTLRIAWTSCNHQRKSTLCPSFASIADSHPDIFIMAGDNIYIDLEPNSMVSAVSEHLAYRCMGSGVLYNEQLDPPYMYDQEYEYLLKKQNIGQIIQDRFADKVVLATWDDHDFRGNYGQRKETKQQVKAHFVKFFETIDFNGKIRAQLGREWEEIVNNPQRGIHYAYDYQKGDVQSRIYVLDNRYYLPSANMLGDAQWQWFETKVADAKSKGITHHVIVNGTNVFTVKMFGLFPEETWTDKGRQKLWEILKRHDIVQQTSLLSGDIHMGVINRKQDLYEFVAPSLTHSVLGFFAQCVECVGCAFGMGGNMCGCYGANGPGCFWSCVSNDNGYAVIDIQADHQRKWAVVGVNPKHNDVDCVVPLQCCGFSA